MKLALLFVVLFFTSASAFTQRVSLSVKAETTLNEVLKQVKDQTGVRILYDAGKMKRVPCREMKITDMEIAEALKQILKDTRFEFFEEGGVFIVREALSQQAKVIRLVGKVTDERKQPLPGVTVQLKGFSIGTATNGEGRYQLSIPNAPEKFSLVFSFVGMVSQEITYAGKDTINVVMKEDVETLEDVVVTGFSNIRSSSFTGNAVTVKKEDLLKVSKTNVIKALQSFDPSFRIKENNRWGSDPNALPEVYIRGESGIGVKQLESDALAKSNLVDNPNLPTFIMDGFEVTAQKVFDLDPNRVRYITILKDAAATAIYGSRAANGVVVIETVLPKAGKLQLSYNGSANFEIADLSDYNLMNAEEKLEYEVRSGLYEKSSKPGWTDDKLDAYNRILKLVKEANDVKSMLKDPYIFDMLTFKSKDRIKAEYALRDIQKPIGISDYELGQALPKDFRGSLPTIEEIEKELESNRE